MCVLYTAASGVAKHICGRHKEGIRFLQKIEC